MELWTLNEAAHYLKRHPEVLRRKSAARQVPAFKLGRDWRFRKEQLDEWIVAGCPTVHEQPSLFGEAAPGA